jgi:hypothetical protein
VVLAGSKNPIPSRTRPLNSPAPMVLSLKTWKSRSLPGLPRTESSLRYHRSPTNARFAIARSGGVAHHKLAKRTHLFPKYKRTRPEKPRGQPLRLFFCWLAVRWPLARVAECHHSMKQKIKALTRGQRIETTFSFASDSFSVNRREHVNSAGGSIRRQRAQKAPALGNGMGRGKW